MNDVVTENVEDAYLNKLKKAKTARVVGKVEFASFKSVVPEGTRVLVVEGPGDKCVYYYWIKQSRPDLEHEYYIGQTKPLVLQLFDLLQSDLTGLGSHVYFILDRDFDGLQGREMHASVFVTDAYSIENYIVCTEVLNDLLCIEFHCNGYPAVREKVTQQFQQVYMQFLEITKNLNFRIFAARQLRVRQTDDLPNKIDVLAKVALESVEASEHAAEEVVKLERELGADELEALKPAFGDVIPQKGYRGKFAMAFFVKWLTLLREDRKKTPSKLFEPIPSSEFAISGNFSISSLAPKSKPPEEFAQFVAGI